MKYIKKSRKSHNIFHNTCELKFNRLRKIAKRDKGEAKEQAAKAVGTNRRNNAFTHRSSYP